MNGKKIFVLALCTMSILLVGHQILVLPVAFRTGLKFAYWMWYGD